MRSLASEASPSSLTVACMMTIPEASDASIHFYKSSKSVPSSWVNAAAAGQMSLFGTQRACSFVVLPWLIPSRLCSCGKGSHNITWRCLLRFPLPLDMC
uniref:Secreted protein n=1 Tax=Meloidogyne incognita TaxID=6306 RepID=A0A914LJ96_MELIC